MKNILTLFALIAAFTITSCKKDTAIAKPEFADIEFKLYDLRTKGDVTIYEVTPPSLLVLKSNFTWTMDLGGAKSSGTYTWAPTTTRQADIKFTIVTWTDFTTNQILSDKLKLALQQVNHCGYSLQDPSFANFLDNSYGDYFASIRANKK